MLTLADVNNIECDEEVSELEYFKSIQRAINSGLAWSFQGSYGRTMMDAISSGRCILGEKGARDYWGNYIPSRHEVQGGTKGSISYVEAHSGIDWLLEMESV